MIALGMNVNADMIKCDACKRLFAIKGVSYGIEREGEYEVTYFACPLCGAKYQILTTDETGREMDRQAREMKERIRVAKEKRFRPGCIKWLTDEAGRIAKERKNRADDLRLEGDRILGRREKL